LLVALLIALVGGLWLSVLSCRDPHAADGAGGQSGDEGFTSSSTALGAGGGAAESPALR
jgi:hypothetical protein